MTIRLYILYLKKEKDRHGKTKTDKKVYKNLKSVFYVVDRINLSLLGKAKKSLYEKGKIFYKYYIDLEDKKGIIRKRTCKT